MRFTPEQLEAIGRREGDLLLDASAGSGKTSVLVERFARAVLEDEVDVGAILTITFTEKAAAELRERIRARLRELGALEAARDTDGAFISTIHGFCARVLRAHALAAGLDPAFSVLDEAQSRRLADAAFDGALEAVAAASPAGVELLASYRADVLRAAILGLFEELRSRGEPAPRLPLLPPVGDAESAVEELVAASRRAAAELGAIANPAVRIGQALTRLERCVEVVALADPALAELDGIALPGGNGAALSTDACAAYADALARYRTVIEHRRAQRVHGALDQLLRGFGERYAAAKRAVSGLDFEDLELLTRELLRDGELRERYRDRFAHVMVDELQDTNLVQLELIESIADGNLFTVGDAQQSIYGFRHADVELFEARGVRLERVGARATLQTSFRSRPEIVAVLNAAFGRAMGASFRPLRPGRTDEPLDAPLVELLVADKGAEWTPDSLVSPWRVAEAQALARRVGELVAGDWSPRDIVVLTRATTDLRAYERALEDAGIPTYVIGGRGYWSHPQIIDLVAYLRALANPRDEEALYSVLASPMVGLSGDGLVLLAAAARAAGRDPWWAIAASLDGLRSLAEDDCARLERFAAWFAAERTASERSGIEELIERMLEVTAYDLTMLRLPGGRRCLANVRKLMRLGREYEHESGRDLRGFLELAQGRAAGRPSAADSRESEAPVEGEALDAVRLMTIHRSKGLEFDVVCVADLGRGPFRLGELIRVGRDGRFGLRLSEPGTGRPRPALDYDVLGQEQQAAEEREERRLFYVAATRARERLILSGAAKLAAWPENGGAGPIGWIGPAFAPDIAERIGEGDRVSDEGVRLTFVRPAEPAPGGDGLRAGAEPVAGPVPAASAGAPTAPPARAAAVPAPSIPADRVAAAPRAARGSPVGRLSYSSLAEYRRCGYRFYGERVLGLPSLAPSTAGAGARTAARRLSAADRGILAHRLLEKLDFRRPAPPDAATIMAAVPAPTAEEAAELAELIARLAGSELAARLGRALDVRREERFAFPLEGEVLMTGAFDVLAREPDNRLLVIDYKSDRLGGARPQAVVAAAYATQQLVYALAALRAGAERVDIVHVFLEAPDEPVSISHGREDVERLRGELSGLAAGVLERRFAVTDAPERLVCSGCPAEGGLCSWPLEMTRRDAPDRLF